MFTNGFGGCFAGEGGGGEGGAGDGGAADAADDGEKHDHHYEREEGVGDEADGAT